MSRKPYLIVILFCVLFAKVAVAQVGYVLTNKGDSVAGKIQLLSYDVDRVQVKTTSDKISFYAVQVKLVSLDGEIYKPVLRADSYLMMKELRAGYLSLFAFREKNQAGFDGLCLVRRDGKSMDVPNLMFKKSVGDFVEDCPEVSMKVKLAQLGKKNIETIVALYNQCIDDRTKLVFTPIPKPDDSITIEKKESVTALTTKVEALESFPDKQNTLDLLKDIASKVSKSEAVPSYLISALNSYIGNKQEVKSEPDHLLNALKLN